MAKAVNPNLSTDSSGTTGGVQHRPFRGKHIIGRRSITHQSGSPAQLNARAAVAKAVHLWQTLGDDFRATWRAGAPFPGLGFGLFIERAVPQLRADRLYPIRPDTPFPYEIGGVAYPETPSSPDWPMNIQILDPNPVEVLWILKAALAPIGAAVPHKRKFIIKSIQDGSPGYISWFPWFEWHHAYTIVEARWLYTGAVVASFFHEWRQ